MTDAAVRRPRRKAPTLNCPGCDGQVAADEAICPHCDHIIDSSFLEDVAAPAPRPARRPAAGGAAPPRRRPAGPRPPGARPPPPRRPRPAQPPSAASRYGEPPPDDDYGPDIAPPTPMQAVPGHAQPEKKEAFTAPDEAVAEFRHFYSSLSRSDRFSFFGAATVALSCFFPWKSTLEDGDVLGIMDLGVIAFIT